MNTWDSIRWAKSVMPKGGGGLDAIPGVGFENHSGRTFIQADQDKVGLGALTVPGRDQRR